ncbi:unnamed protein product [Allacma fusca]|uniref:Uncharacterized protein n=1 Tax=Allacma fusca TaxID=39272 RepID=A0A8J2JU55_9HEXA|nr:unnamed protein product [Allacma fusca]
MTTTLNCGTEDHPPKHQASPLGQWKYYRQAITPFVQSVIVAGWHLFKSMSLCMQIPHTSWIDPLYPTMASWTLLRK